MKAKSGFDDAHINADPRYFFENKSINKALKQAKIN